MYQFETVNSAANVMSANTAANEFSVRDANMVKFVKKIKTAFFFSMMGFLSFFSIKILMMGFLFFFSSQSFASTDLQHVKYMGYYCQACQSGGIPGDISFIPEVQDHNNIVWVRGPDWIEKIQSAHYRGMKVILMLDIFLMDENYFLLPNYPANWQSVRTLVNPYRSTIVGFYTLDEPYAKALKKQYQGSGMNAQIMKSNIEAIHRMVKRDFPEWVSILNFAYGEIPTYEIPEMTDWVGVDYYGAWDEFDKNKFDWWPAEWREAFKNIKTFEDQLAALKSKMKPDQRMILFPETFIQYSTLRRIENEPALVSRLEQYVNYAKKEKSVIALFPFLYGNFREDQQYYQGARELPTLLNRLRTLGQSIVKAENQVNPQKLDMVLFSRGGTSGSQLEVSRLNAYSYFQQFNMRQLTPLQLSGSDWQFKSVDWDRDGILDVAAIKSKNTESRMIEVHILSGVSQFQSFSLQTTIPITQSTSDIDFIFSDWDKDGILDLGYIKKTSTESGYVELHVLSGASLFKRFIIQTRTQFPSRSSQVADYTMADLNLDGYLDLVLLYRNLQSGKIELHALTGADYFKSFILNVSTPLGAASTNHQFVFFDWNYDGYPDLLFIDKNPKPNNLVEFHMLSGALTYQGFILNTRTPVNAGLNLEFDLGQGFY
jgi:hypothetical protein